MRPLVLKMSAFGPYADETVIPMEELGSKGLYLITGDTGAGKTTIFDAICFALFGEASGTSRSAAMLRSQYAAKDTPTEVELEFIHNGKEYVVKRNPEYTRPAKKGDGVVREPADASLTMPDGAVISKVKNVNAKVEELLGINRDQFSQIAMLAQGDFKKMLFSDTKQKIEIFRELFKTGYYQRLQIELAKEKSELEKKAEDYKKNTQIYVGGIEADEDDLLANDVNNVKENKDNSNQTTCEDLIALVDKIVAGDNERQIKINNELERINSELEEVNRKLGKAKELEDTKKKLEKEKELLEECNVKAKDAKEQFVKAEKQLKDNKDSLISNASKIESKLKDYDELEEIDKSIEDKIRKINSFNKKLRDNENSLERIKNAIDSLKLEQQSLENAGAQIEKLKADFAKTCDNGKALEELYGEFSACRKLKDKLQILQLDYIKKKNKSLEADKKYDAMEQRFRDGQAGILALTLKDGDMCPVCGSRIHPKLACLKDNVPTKEELEKEKNNCAAAKNEYDESWHNVTDIKDKTYIKYDVVKKQAAKYLKDFNIDASDSKSHETQGENEGHYYENFDEIFMEAFKVENKNVKDAIKELQDKIKEEEKKIKRKQEIDLQLPKLEKERDEIDKSITDLKNGIAVATTSQKENIKQRDNLKKNLEFESKIAANAKIKELKEEANRLQKNFDEAKKEADDCNKLTDNHKGAIKAYEKTLDKAKDELPDIEKLTSQRETLTKERNEYSDKDKVVSARINSNGNIVKNLKNLSKEWSELEKKLSWVGTLSDTANGKLAGKDKIMLETYIQTAYFERIIERANLRLMTMSRGQYELKRKEEAANGRSQSGLELDVIDHYNGSERSVKSLSGGESFMASLSLALGLSDEIQASAGGISVDTIFVDEGFGSLDTESLDQAYAALAGLTEGNRLVGIISHVGDLKEKIDKQIVVTKGKCGGSHAKIVGII